MSFEKKISSGESELPYFTTPIQNEEVSSKRVDINVLLNRARKTQEKETRTNLVLAGLGLCLVIVVGLILSF
jgi:preprotein translocase subunit Sss1